MIKLDRYRLYKLSNGVISITFVNTDHEQPIKNKKSKLYKYKID